MAKYANAKEQKLYDSFRTTLEAGTASHGISDETLTLIHETEPARAWDILVQADADVKREREKGVQP